MIQRNAELLVWIAAFLGFAAADLVLGYNRDRGALAVGLLVSIGLWTQSSPQSSNFRKISLAVLLGIAAAPIPNLALEGVCVIVLLKLGATFTALRWFLHKDAASC